MNISLDKKILAGFVLSAVVLAVVAAISFKNSEKFVDTNQWVNHTHEVLYELEETLVSAVNAETGARGFVITRNENYLEPYNAAKQKLAEHLDRTEFLTVDNPIQQKNIKELRDLISAHLNHLEACVDLRKKDFESAQKLVQTGRGKLLLDEVRRKIDTCKGIEQTLLVQRGQESTRDARNFNFIFITLLGVIIFALVVVYFIISTNLKALRKAERETADRNWSLTGSGNLTRVMQGNKVVADLAQLITDQLAEYLNAQVGAFYLTENDGRHLKLAGIHAVSEEKKSASLVVFGQGLVGQCAADRKTSLIKEVPEHYFDLDTGFGRLRPRTIIVVPIMFESKVIGVLELGTVHNFSELQNEFLQRVADSIAIAISSAQSRQKTKELLEETQTQAEELEVQQEELRQSNEELLTKTELLEKSEQELKVQQEELQTANEELEENANLLEDQKSVLEQAKAEIETKVIEIEQTSKYKSEFLANMSHELRTPLNSILILSQLLTENKTKVLGEKEIEFARNIHNSGADLLNLIDEILDLSKVEAGKMQLDIGEVPFQNIMNGMFSMFSELAKRKGIEFAIQFDKKSTPPVMTTDRQRLEQVLRNLLSNAFKFTPRNGNISLTIERAKPGIQYKNKNLSLVRDIVSFSVVDTGIGIPKEKLSIIFEAFQQADGSTKRKYGGTGLGLSISRELASAMGGEIHLASEEGKGSTFTLFLPVAFDPSLSSPSAREIEIRTEQPQEEKRTIEYEEQITLADESEVYDDRNGIQPGNRLVLIIEDDEAFAKVLLDFVRERKYKGIIADQGRDGISFARRYKPDAILLDMKLPLMDGAEVLKQIKSDPDLRHIPVQIISASDQKKLGLELGAFDFLTKPVTTTGLKKVFDRIETFTSKKLKKLLIVEDNRQQNKAIKELIGNNDVKCYSAYLGSEAHEMLLKDAFDCIIVDLGLPDMSGFELLEKIKANENLNRIPVVVYTGKDLAKEDSARLRKLSDTVVLKTADSQERLLDETILFLHRIEAKLPKEKQAMIRKLHKSDEALKDKKILVADDDMRNIYSITNALEEEGLRCISAENGKVALDILKKDPTFDLVLMDIMMPEMDGYEATIEIRKIERFKKLPIIALTAKAMKGDKEKCLAVGMSDYISKPVNLEQLLSLMRVWLYR